MRRHRSSWTLIALGLTALLAVWIPLGLAGCSKSADQAPGLGNTTQEAGSGASCQFPGPGCACSAPGTTMSCKEWELRSGNYVTCREGAMLCQQSGVWSPCADPGTLSANASTDSLSLGGIRAQTGSISLTGITAQSFGTNANCGGDGGDADPCDPSDTFDTDSGAFVGCNQVTDDPSGIDAAPRFVITDAGLTPLPDLTSEAGITCTGLAVSPPTMNLTVTSFDPITTTPAMADFTAAYTPAACYSGLANAAWSIDRTDLGAISNGNLTLVSGVAGPINVSGYATGFQATALVNVTTNVLDTSQVTPAVAAQFTGAPAAADSINWLYPYSNTVFPRSVAAPIVQYDNKGVAASSVKVSIVYPATGAPIFTDSVIVPESNPPQVQIDQAGWGYFDETAAGQDALITVQRVVGGVLLEPNSLTIHFATSPLRGNIFYTEYDNTAWTATVKSIQPGGTTPAEVALPGSGCNPCHSLSANGTTLVTSNWGNNNTSVARVNGDGTLTGLGNMWNQPSPPAQDSRGFAYSAISADGAYALQGSNWWGNTVEPGSSNQQASAPHNNGSGLTGQYYANLTQTGTPATTTTDTTIDFDWGGTSPQTGISAGSSYSVVWSGYVQAIFSETYTFDVESSDGVILSVGGNTLINALGPQTDQHKTATLAMTAGQKVPITLTYENVSGDAQVHLRWSSPSQPYQIIAETQLYPSAAAQQDGLYGAYYDNITNPQVVFPAVGATPTNARVDPGVAFQWNGASPISGVAGDNFGARWTGNVTIPCTGSYTFCVTGDDGVRLWLDGALVADGWFYQGQTQYCAPATNYTAASSHAIRMDYFQGGGGAVAGLSWAAACMGTASQTQIPATNLTPSQTVPPPTNGLTGTYYDSLTFSGPSTTEIDSPIDFNWNGQSPVANVGGDNWTAEWTGQVQIPCDGSYAFCVVGDDGVRLWIDGALVDDGWVAQGPTSYCNSVSGGAGITEAAGSMHDVKMDYFQEGGGSVAQLQWVSTCIGGGQQDIPTADLFPTGDQGTGGYDIPFHNAGDLGTGAGYSILQLPTAVNGSPIDVTGANSWGLGTTAMMVPAFSPDNTKLVFVDGDTTGGASWRQGLSFFNFNEAAQSFSGRTNVVNTLKSGLVIRWPTVETDSRSVIYQTNPTSQDDIASYAQYGGMLPSGYSTIPGQLYSVDMLSSNPTPVSLDKLNAGLGTDSNLSYQPTMLPVAAGGYRWTVFTSDWQYGNTQNVVGSGIEPTTQLWVGALDDATSATVDRSHPPFRLSNQTPGDNGGRIRNERAYWVLDACKPSLSNLNPPSGGTPPAFTWTDMDIGSPGVAGSAMAMGTEIQMTGGGSDIWNNSDQFNYAYMPVSGDFVFVARVDSITEADVWSKAGIMLRDSLDADAVFAHMMISAGGDSGLQWRTGTSQGCNWTQGPSESTPVWIRLSRASGVVNGDVSTDGVTWTNTGTLTPAIGDSAYIGLAVTAHNNALSSTAVFDNVGFVAATPADPRPASLCQDDQDCCGALTTPATAACQVDVPIETTPLKHCLLLSSNTCVALGDACASDADCCGFPTNHCDTTGKCAVPPPPFPYKDAVFSRDYTGSCPATYQPIWRNFFWQANTPGDSDIQFSVATAQTEADLPATISAMGVVPLAKAPSPMTYSGYAAANVGDALKAGGQLATGNYVRVYMDFQPSTDDTQVATLQNWYIQYDCVAAE